MLFVICWSGTFAVLSHEFDWLATTEVRAGSEGEWASWGTWAAAVQAAFPEAEISWLEAPLSARNAALVVINLPNQDLVRVYVDPHTAEILGYGSYYTVQRFFRNLHMSLFMPKVGVYVVGAFAVALLSSLISALVFYRRWWKRFFLLPRGAGRAFWSNLHKTTGLWSTWFLLLIGITGGWYFFEIVRIDLLDGKFSWAGTGASAVKQIPKPRSSPELPRLSLDKLVERVRQVRPDLQIRTVSTAFSHEGVFYANGQTDHFLLRDRANQIHLDARTGEILFDQNASHYPLYWRWSDTADSLHFGNFGGLASKLVWFFFGLLLSGLILTGTYLHAQRLAREVVGGKGHRWPGTGAALLASVLLLAVAVPFGLEQARNVYGPTVEGIPQLPTLAPGVKVVMYSWIAFTVAIIAAWVYLLWRPRFLR